MGLLLYVDGHEVYLEDEQLRDLVRMRGRVRMWTKRLSESLQEDLDACRRGDAAVAIVDLDDVVAIVNGYASLFKGDLSMSTIPDHASRGPMALKAIMDSGATVRIVALSFTTPQSQWKDPG